MDNNGIVQVALKKKMNFKSNVYLESVRLNIVQEVLFYLKLVNPLYSNIEIDLENIPQTWTNLGSDKEINDQSENDEMEIDFVCDSTIESIKNNNDNEITENICEESEEEDENPLYEHRLPLSGNNICF